MVQIVSLIGLLIVVGTAMAFNDRMNEGGRAFYEDRTNFLPGLIMVLGYIIYGWINIATSVRRLHDQDKSGGMIFINIIPVIGPLWMLIVLGFIRGTGRTNQYGAPPL